jgi:hypothetical protein
MNLHLDDLGAAFLTLAIGIGAPAMLLVVMLAAF